MTDESLIHTHLEHYSPSALLRRGPRKAVACKLQKLIRLHSYDEPCFRSNPSSLASTMHHGFYCAGSVLKYLKMFGGTPRNIQTHVFLCCENAGAFFNVIPHLEHLSPSAIFIGCGDTLSAARNIRQSCSCLERCILCLKDDLNPAGSPRHVKLSLK